MHIRRKLAALVTAAGLICTLTVTSSVVLGAGGSQSADIDQCANGSGASIACLGNGSGNTGWVNGNLGASKSHYSEGQSIPYRIRFSNLQGGASKTHTVTIQARFTGDALAEFPEFFPGGVFEFEVTFTVVVH